LYQNFILVVLTDGRVPRYSGKLLVLH